MTSIISLLFAVCSITYLVLGCWLIVRGTQKAHRLYGSVCIATSLWQGAWAILFGGVAEPIVMLSLRIAYPGIVFIPAIFYHFIYAVSGDSDEKVSIWVLYGLSACIALTAVSGNLLINGLNHYSWGISARAGIAYPVFSLEIVYVFLRVVTLLSKMSLSYPTPEVRRKQNKWIIAAAATYCGGAFDSLSNYGVSLFPLSLIFVGSSVVLFAIAIIRYSFLNVSLSEESNEFRHRREAAAAEMKQIGMTAAFPLVSQGEVLGFLLLGEKMSEESYSMEDLRLLRIVANQAALAYQRVRFLEMAVHGARTEMLGEIAGGFAHEIKTPLANISLPAELSILDLADVEKGLKKFEDVLPELKNRMRDIMHQTFKASEKIEAIRQFSKPGQIQLAQVDLTSVLQNSLGLLDHLLKKTGTKVRTIFPSVMSQVRGDAKQLEIVFVNLIKNAAEAMSQNSSQGLAREIWLKGYEDGNWVAVSVKDTGPGIKRTEFAHLFEAYFTTKGSSGTGMGLFLSRQVIKAHGGSIDVKSEEGKGTEFTIRLPKAVSESKSGLHEAA